jgi:hypothetical protein
VGTGALSAASRCFGRYTVSVQPFAWCVDGGDDSFVIYGEDGWLAVIAHYLQFPSPRRKRDGYPVLIPGEGETYGSVHTLLSHAELPAEFLSPARSALDGTP